MSALAAGLRGDIPSLQRGVAEVGTSVTADVRRLKPGKGERQWSQLISEWYERGNFIVARTATHASVVEWKAVDGMLKQLPIAPETFAADTTYTSGCLREHEDDMGITAYIRFHPNQARNMVAKCGFDYVCLEGKVLPKSAFLKHISMSRVSTSVRGAL